jgi:type I restriction enzyme S subunit
MQKGNPDTDAAALLAKIKSEKQQLIADGNLKKENILPEISPDKIPFILPNTWVWCPLGEVTHFIDYRGKTPTKITSGIRLITAKNVKQGYLSLSPDEYISEQEYEERMTRGYPQLGDVFFTTEAPLGNACLNNLDEPISMGQRIITIRSIAFLSSYLLKVILSPAIQKEIDIRKTGVTAQGIKSKRLVEVPFPLPPLAEQKAIVEKVDKLMNIIDQLEQQIKHRKQLAENLMQTVLREAFE